MMSREIRREAFIEHVEQFGLVDHHVHGAFTASMPRSEFEQHISEGSPDPIPEWMTQFDSQLGFAIRKWCAPVLGLPEHAPADDYWAQRSDLGVAEVNRRLIRGARVTDWLVDTGYAVTNIHTPAELAEVSGGRSAEIVRIEVIAETIAAEAVPAEHYADEFRHRLRAATADAVGLKTIIAYRTGFDIDLTCPSPREVTEAARRWIGSLAGVPPRLADPVLLRFGLHAAAEIGKPIQFHAGFGDRDLDLHKANPMYLLDLLRQPGIANVPIMLLHCYPYHREAGYLAQSFNNVYFDVGLGVNYSGVNSAGIIREALEVAPFAKQLYSSDAWGPPELHYLGSVLWRRGVIRTVGEWVAEGDWSLSDAIRVVEMVGRDNAARVYGLTPGS
jgi:uncharacterized protein